MVNIPSNPSTASLSSALKGLNVTIITENIIEASIVSYNDFSGAPQVRTTLLFPWSSPIKLSDPITIPTDAPLNGGGPSCAWSPNGEYLAVNSNSSPFVTIYQRQGVTFTKLADPGTLPSNAARASAWSPDGQFLALGTNVYQRVGSVFTKLTTPTTAAARGCAWSPSGEFLAISGVSGSPVLIWQLAGTTFTQLSSPASLPSSTNGCAWSPNGEYLTFADNSGATAIFTYQRSGNTFIKVSDPATLPSSIGLCCAWSPDGDFVAISTNNGSTSLYQFSENKFIKNAASISGSAHQGIAWSPNSKYLALTSGNSPKLQIYERSGTNFTRISDPPSIPASTNISCNWSNDGQFFAVTSSSSPPITIYQTSADMPDAGVIQIIKQMKRSVT